MLKDKTIIVGVTGGIAAYKAADLVSRLKKQNANVDVIMTKSATEFVNPLTFQTLSNNPVHLGMFDKIVKWDVEHISLAKKADMILVAPATANTIGKIANGLADDLLTTTIMASRAKIVFAPAMNTGMYTNPIFQENMLKLKKLGYEFVSPGSGMLACGDYGQGRMAEPADIVEYVIDAFKEKDLAGKRVVITAGPTIEAIDPVRYITNHSSGKMGYLLAREANARGARVVLISGPTALEPPRGVEFVRVNTTVEMFKAVGDYFASCDILIKAAAPADYRPEAMSETKIKKKDDGKDELNIRLVRNPDIAHYYGNRKDRQIVIGFAAETDNLVDYAREKLRKKNFDFIVANDVTQEGAGFKSDTNIVTIIDEREEKAYPRMDKRGVASLILDKARDLIEEKGL